MPTLIIVLLYCKCESVVVILFSYTFTHMPMILSLISSITELTIYHMKQLIHKFSMIEAAIFTTKVVLLKQ